MHQFLFQFLEFYNEVFICPTQLSRLQQLVCPLSLCLQKTHSFIIIIIIINIIIIDISNKYSSISHNQLGDVCSTASQKPATLKHRLGFEVYSSAAWTFYAKKQKQKTEQRLAESIYLPDGFLLNVHKCGYNGCYWHLHFWLFFFSFSYISQLTSKHAKTISKPSNSATWNH